MALNEAGMFKEHAKKTPSFLFDSLVYLPLSPVLIVFNNIG
jgi:hypothetical protein